MSGSHQHFGFTVVLVLVVADAIGAASVADPGSHSLVVALAVVFAVPPASVLAYRVGYESLRRRP